MHNFCKSVEELKTKISELSTEKFYVIEIDAHIEQLPKIVSVFNEEIAKKQIACIFVPKGIVTIHELQKGDL